VDRVRSTKLEGKDASAFKVMNDADGSIPMFRVVAIKDSGKSIDCKRNVGVSGNSKVVKATDKGTIWGVIHPRSHVRKHEKIGVWW
jgi:hypothetical protein